MQAGKKGGSAVHTTYQHPESLRLAWAKQDPVSKGKGDIADRYTDCAPGASEKVASVEMSLICA